MAINHTHFQLECSAFSLSLILSPLHFVGIFRNIRRSLHDWTFGRAVGATANPTSRMLGGKNPLSGSCLFTHLVYLYLTSPPIGSSWSLSLLSLHVIFTTCCEVSQAEWLQLALGYPRNFMAKERFELMSSYSLSNILSAMPHSNNFNSVASCLGCWLQI